MAHTPAMHDPADINSADDMRTIGPALMLVSGIVAVLIIMAIVYSPRMWGISAFGEDVTGAGVTQSAPSGAGH